MERHLHGRAATSSEALEVDVMVDLGVGQPSNLFEGSEKQYAHPSEKLRTAHHCAPMTMTAKSYVLVVLHDRVEDVIG